MKRDMRALGRSTLSMYEKSHETKCAECGKLFLRTSEHMYKRQDHGLKFYCSYTCWRVKQRIDEEKERERFRARLGIYDRMQEANKASALRSRALRDAENKGEILMEQSVCKIREYEQRLLSAEPGSHERMMARKNLTYWEKRLGQAKRMLEEEKAKEDSVRKEA